MKKVERNFYVISSKIKDSLMSNVNYTEILRYLINIEDYTVKKFKKFMFRMASILRQQENSKRTWFNFNSPKVEILNEE